MDISLLLALILLIVAFILWYRNYTSAKKISELERKTHFSIQGDSLMKVTFEGQKKLSEIAQHFNVLVSRYQGMKGDAASLLETSEQKDELDAKVKDFETSLSQITMLTDIGKHITSSLNIHEILRIVNSYVKSSMDTEGIELLVLHDNLQTIYFVDGDDNISEYQNELKQDIMLWTLENKKEVFLNDAIADYAQFVFDPISSSQGSKPAALMCIPMFLHDNQIGALAVASAHPNVYSSYHMNFLRTLASYIAVALDNSRVYQLLETGKQQIELEKSKSDELLLNILPAEIAEELKENGTAKARKFDDVSILFTDFKEFTQASEKLSPEELVHDINHCFKAFDRICDEFRIEKIKTIGDSYMAAGGIPVPDSESTSNTVLAACAMADFMAEYREERLKSGDLPFEMRIGINTGPVVAGIVGVKKFQYDIWGDAVNMASRMESNGEVGKINISQFTFELIKDLPGFTFIHRGKIPAKGKGEVDMYFVNRGAKQLD